MRWPTRESSFSALFFLGLLGFVALAVYRNGQQSAEPAARADGAADTIRERLPDDPPTDPVQDPMDLATRTEVTAGVGVHELAVVDRPPSASGIAVRVLDASGGPLEGAPATLVAIIGQARIELGQKLTDSEGRATLQAERGVKRPSTPAPQFAVTVGWPAPDMPSFPVFPDGPVTDEITLRLPHGSERLAEPLRVRVLDAEGLPAEDVPLRLVARVSPGSHGDQPDGAARTDAAGEATISRADAFRRIMNARAFGTALEHFVVVDVLAISPARQPVDLMDPESVTLTLPPTGALRVIVTDATGAPAPPGTTVTVDAHAPGSQALVARERKGVEGGAAVFPRVAAGLTLSIQASERSGARGPATHDLPGPTRLGVTEVALALGPAWPTIVLRPVGHEGAGDASAEVQVAFAPRDDLPSPAASLPKRYWSRLAPDADGRVTVIARPPLGTHPTDLLIERGDTFARVTLHTPLSDRITDLGDVLMRPTPILVSGRVTEDGAPARGVRMWPRVPCSNGDDISWQNLPGAVRSTAADGTFTIRYVELPERVRISAARNGGKSSLVEEVRAGTEGVLLELLENDSSGPSGGLMGALASVAGIPTPTIEAVLTGVGRTRTAELYQSLFGFRQLPAGRYDLEIRTRSTGFCLARIEGVQVIDGQPATDPRLLAIDVATHTGALHILALDQNTKPITEEGLRVEDEAGHGGFLRTDEDGRLFALVPRDGRRYIVRRGDHRSAAISPMDAEQTLVIE